MPEHNNIDKAKNLFIRNFKDHPLNWHQWGDDALKLAKDQDKPIYLFITNKTCLESRDFLSDILSKKSVVDFLNKEFICVAIDKYEFPDIDDIYMVARQVIDNGGSWPNNIFISHNKEPFFAGGLFNDELDFLESLERVILIWRMHKNQINDIASRLNTAINVNFTSKNIGYGYEGEYLQMVKLLYTQLSNKFDNEFGGFKEKYKFLNENYILFLLEYYENNKDKKIAKFLKNTLDNIYKSKIFDSKKGGFFKFTLDEKWENPTNEKKLYNQAYLLECYVKAYELLENTAYKDVAENIVSSIINNFYNKSGYFYLSILYDKKEEIIDKNSITSINLIMVKSLLVAGNILKKKKYINMALKVLSYIDDKIVSNKIPRLCNVEKYSNYGYLDDYANYLSALIAVYEAVGEKQYLDKALKILSYIDKNFWDKEDGGYFYTISGIKNLVRIKTAIDSYIFCENSLMLKNLIKLSKLTNKKYDNKINQIISLFMPEISHNPKNYTSFITSIIPLCDKIELSKKITSYGVNQPPELLSSDYVMIDIDDVKQISEDSYHVFVRLEISDGWYINSNAKSLKYLVPTQINFKHNDKYEITDTQYLASKKAIKFEGSIIPVFSKLAIIKLTVKLNKDITNISSANIAAILTIQACNEQKCLRPVNFMLSL